MAKKKRPVLYDPKRAGTRTMGGFGPPAERTDLAGERAGEAAAAAAEA